MSILNELIKDAFDIAHKKNQSYTRQEANQYDPLISTLYKALMQSDLEDLEKLEADQCIIRREKN